MWNNDRPATEIKMGIVFDTRGDILIVRNILEYATISVVMNTIIGEADEYFPYCSKFYECKFIGRYEMPIQKGISGFELYSATRWINMKTVNME
jgi:hypothetical protein